MKIKINIKKNNEIDVAEKALDEFYFIQKTTYDM